MELLVFKADQSESATVISPGMRSSLPRGRLDHKDRGETKLVVQEAERFEPDSGEIARANLAASSTSGPLRLTIDAAKFAPAWSMS